MKARFETPFLLLLWCSGVEGGGGVTLTPVYTAKGFQARQATGTGVGCATQLARARASQLWPEPSGPLSPRLLRPTPPGVAAPANLFLFACKIKGESKPAPGLGL